MAFRRRGTSSTVVRLSQLARRLRDRSPAKAVADAHRSGVAPTLRLLRGGDERMDLRLPVLAFLAVATLGVIALVGPDGPSRADSSAAPWAAEVGAPTAPSLPEMSGALPTASGVAAQQRSPASPPPSGEPRGLPPLSPDSLGSRGTTAAADAAAPAAPRVQAGEEAELGAVSGGDAEGDAPVRRPSPSSTLAPTATTVATVAALPPAEVTPTPAPAQLTPSPAGTPTPAPPPPTAAPTPAPVPPPPTAAPTPAPVPPPPTAAPTPAPVPPPPTAAPTPAPVPPPPTAAPTPTATPPPEPTDSPVPACSDGIDNDGDLLVDWPLDLGCTAPGDPDEAGPVL